MWYVRNRQIRALSDAQARLFGGSTANMISVHRMIMAASIPFILHAGFPALAAVVFAVAAYLDFVDGAVARHQQDTGGWRIAPEDEARLGFFAKLRLKGCTETGKWLDPLADKILIQATLFSLGWGAVPHALLFAGLALAAALTFARPFKVWMAARGWRTSADGRANTFGKMKMCVEVATVALLFMGDPSGWRGLILHAILTMTFLSAAVLLAALSLVFHLLPARKRE